MKLIVGLGNPGSKYEDTRHNTGFIAIDEFAKKSKVDFKLEKKFQGMIASVSIDGYKAVLLKPQTFMNLSGESVIKALKYYKIDVDDMLVISDDLDSPTGRVRLRSEGSAGGHNGHKSIIQCVQTSAYKRIKIGIGRSTVISVVDWVLQKFTKDEQILIESACGKTCDAIEAFIKDVPFNKIASCFSTK